MPTVTVTVLMVLSKVLRVLCKDFVRSNGQRAPVLGTELASCRLTDAQQGRNQRRRCHFRPIDLDEPRWTATYPESEARRHSRASIEIGLGLGSLAEGQKQILWGPKLDQKFRYRSVHAACVNAKWYETWLERTLFVDPIIYDVQEPGVLSRMQGQLCDLSHKTHRHWSRHTCCSVFVVVLSLITSWWEATAAAACTRSDAFFNSFSVRPFAVTRRILRWRQRFPFARLCLVICLSGDEIACICAFFLSQFSTPLSRRSTAAAGLSASLHGCTASYVRTRSRHIFTASFYGAFCDAPRGTRTTWAVAFTRINGRTTTVTEMTATAAATLSLRVCLCFSSQPLPQDDDGGYLPRCLLPQAARHGQALCHLSRHISERYPPRASS